jgi:hypothetical protein
MQLGRSLTLQMKMPNMTRVYPFSFKKFAAQVARRSMPRSPKYKAEVRAITDEFIFLGQTLRQLEIPEDVSGYSLALPKDNRLLYHAGEGSRIATKMKTVAVDKRLVDGRQDERTWGTGILLYTGARTDVGKVGSMGIEFGIRMSSFYSPLLGAPAPIANNSEISIEHQIHFDGNVTRGYHRDVDRIVIRGIHRPGRDLKMDFGDGDGHVVYGMDIGEIHLGRSRADWNPANLRKIAYEVVDEDPDLISPFADSGDHGYRRELGNGHSRSEEFADLARQVSAEINSALSASNLYFSEHEKSQNDA